MVAEWYTIKVTIETDFLNKVNPHQQKQNPLHMHKISLSA